MENKHILVVDGTAEAHKKLLEKKAFVSWITDVTRMKDRNNYYHKIGIHSDSNSEDWLYWVNCLNIFKKVDYIVNFSENNQDKTALISKELGLNYHSIETIEAVNNKFVMRNILEEEFDYRIINDATDLFDFIEDNEKPIILKPLNGSGSESVFLLTSRADVLNIIERNEINFIERKYIAEEYLNGKEYSLEIFSNNGSHMLITITEKMIDENFVEIGHCVPAPLDKKTYDILKNYTFNILNKLNINDGITHTEVILEGNRPRIIETHLRAGGDKIVDITKNALGVDMYEVWADSVLNNSIHVNDLEQQHLNPKKYSAIHFLRSKKTGTIKNIDINDCYNSYIEEVKLFKSVGDEVKPAKQSLDRLGYVIATMTSYDETLKKAEDAIKNIHVEIT